MTRQELKFASEALQEASTTVTNADARTRIEQQATAIAELAGAGRGPDHGRLARHEHILESIEDTVDPETATSIHTATEHIRTYRETIEGV